ncbi:glycosyltransferase [Zunongwangia sp. F363]|uniref:Glycosyltransferase n=1 Tax=Autumnicola tepida TaxID=3075595 RepID=A0ABU3CBY7_9FLAO|nr:glycosyltransferase [Zunongwangia sp. F363]MDT0643851.1 glycosyltransferase [Zunongwangia sp. F363]
MLLSLFIFIAACYLALVLALIYGWNKAAVFKSVNAAPHTKFSIVVPFRNEANNLPALLGSLAKLKYPATHFELLLVNDASEDASAEVCELFRKENPGLQIVILESLSDSNSPKKEALKKGIENGSFEYILTTDADCEVPELWLQSYNDFILTSAATMICGPVKFKEEKPKKLFQKFEELDFYSLQATTAGAFGIGMPFMCNGANLCYKKENFIQAEGFSGNDKIASGDDVFLLQKFQEKGYATAYLKSENAVVETRPQQSFSQLISQRIRWAAKTTAYHSVFARFAGLGVLLMNFSLLLAAFLVLFKIFPQQPILVIFLLKFNADFILIFLAAKFFERELIMRNYFWCSIVYPFFSTFVAVISLFSGFDWKGRKFKS